MAEADVKKEINKVLRKFGVYTFMPVPGGYGKGGVHDHIVCYMGFFISIEAKADAKKEPSGLQIKNAREIIAAGGCALLIHDENIHEVTRALESLDARVRPVSVWPDLINEVV